jgi:UDP-2,3-diacylglucosamine pyrophosphatase LpxH
MEVIGLLHALNALQQGRINQCLLHMTLKGLQCWFVSGDRDFLAKNWILVIHITASQYTN